MLPGTSLLHGNYLALLDKLSWFKYTIGSPAPTWLPYFSRSSAACIWNATAERKFQSLVSIKTSFQCMFWKLILVNRKVFQSQQQHRQNEYKQGTGSWNGNVRGRAHGNTFKSTFLFKEINEIYCSDGSLIRLSHPFHRVGTSNPAPTPSLHPKHIKPSSSSFPSCISVTDSQPSLHLLPLTLSNL